MASTFNQLSITTNRNNTGHKKKFEDFGHDKMIILVPPGAYMTDEDTAQVLANWLTKFNLTESDRWYPFHRFFGVPEIENQETIYEESNGENLKVKEGVRIFTGYIKTSLVEHKNLRSFNSGTWKCYIVTMNEYIKGTTSDDTKFEPFTCQLVEIEKQTSNDGSIVEKTPVKIILDNAIEWDDRGAWVKLSSGNPLEDFSGLQDVEAYDAGSSTTAILNIGFRQTGDLVDITGLVKEDILILGSDGAEDVVSAITDNGDGTYACTLTGGGADTYTCGLQNSEDMTTQGYEIYSTVSITVS